MNWYLDVFAHDHSNTNAETLRTIESIMRQDAASGPCDDDVEVTCPYVDMLPDESEHEGGSPLNFTTYPAKKMTIPRFLDLVKHY